MLVREHVLNVLKFHLLRAQDRMSNQANKHRSDRSFLMGDYVYLKLQPHRQVTIRQHHYHKLTAKYFGPFQVEAKISEVSYKHKLPESSAICPVFHVSRLKLCRSAPILASVLPTSNDSGLLAAQPIAILERKLGKKNGKNVMFILVQRSNGSIEETTWEVYGELLARFLQLDSIFGHKKV